MDQSTYTPALHAVPALPDRCDRCGAAARLRMTLAEGALAFCGHHANNHAGAIIRTAVGVFVTADFTWVGSAALGTAVSTVEGSGGDVGKRAQRSFRNSR